MKWLVSAACVAVISFVGYFFWGEWSRDQERQVAAQSVIDRLSTDARARESLFEHAEAELGDEARVADYCARVTDASANLVDNSLANNLAHNCRYFGYIE